MDNDQSFLVCLRGHDLVACGFLLGHLNRVAFCIFGHLGILFIPLSGKSGHPRG
jgi:hypothetical protein